METGAGAAVGAAGVARGDVGAAAVADVWPGRAVARLGAEPLVAVHPRTTASSRPATMRPVPPNPRHTIHSSNGECGGRAATVSLVRPRSSRGLRADGHSPAAWPARIVAASIAEPAAPGNDRATDGQQATHHPEDIPSRWNRAGGGHRQPSRARRGQGERELATRQPRYDRRPGPGAGVGPWAHACMAFAYAEQCGCARAPGAVTVLFSWGAARAARRVAHSGQRRRPPRRREEDAPC